uniref:F-box domain-containing protein n=1 Tax=Steinernema glaseri TaxID=37863 RepID=A0A1I7Y5T4_9BILA
MDHLSYDLVEEVVSFLPRSDVETIAKVASRCTDLENWSFAAEDQLENRFLLDVDAYVQSVFVTEEEYSDEEDDFIEEDVEMRIFILVTRDLPNGKVEDWNFLRWRYAWIRHLTITALRVISLPVDPSVGASFSVEQNMLYRQEALDVYCKMLKAVQKGFVKVELSDDDSDADRIKELAIESLNKEIFLEKLIFQDCDLPPDAMAEISEAIAFEFGRKRGRSLEVRIPSSSNEKILPIVKRIAENWHQSDGAFEEKQVTWNRFPDVYDDPWFAIAESYEAIVVPT